MRWSVCPARAGCWRRRPDPGSPPRRRRSGPGGRAAFVSGGWRTSSKSIESTRLSSRREVSRELVGEPRGPVRERPPLGRGGGHPAPRRRLRAGPLRPAAQATGPDPELDEDAAGPPVHVEIVARVAGHPLRGGDPVDGFEFRLQLAGELERELGGGA